MAINTPVGTMIEWLVNGRLCRVIEEQRDAVRVALVRPSNYADAEEERDWFDGMLLAREDIAALLYEFDAVELY